MKTAKGVAAVIVLAATALSPALMAQEPPSDDGAGLFKQHCSMCHQIENSTDQRLPEAEWRAIVDRMITNGAEISPADQAKIVGYLSKNYGPSAPAAGSPGAP